MPLKKQNPGDSPGFLPPHYRRANQNRASSYFNFPSRYRTTRNIELQAIRADLPELQAFVPASPPGAGSLTTSWSVGGKSLKSPQRSTQDSSKKARPLQG